MRKRSGQRIKAVKREEVWRRERENGESYKRVQTQVETYEKWRENRSKGEWSPLMACRGAQLRNLSSSVQADSLTELSSCCNPKHSLFRKTNQTNKQICFQLWWSKKSGGEGDSVQIQEEPRRKEEGQDCLLSCTRNGVLPYGCHTSDSCLPEASSWEAAHSGENEVVDRKSFVSELEPALDPRKSAPKNLRARGKMVTTLNTHCWTLSGWDMTVNISFKPCENPSGQVLLLLLFLF